MDYDQGHKAAQLMEQIGGGFASALALAFYKADSRHASIMLEAYEDIFMRHYDMAVARESKATA